MIYDSALITDYELAFVSHNNHPVQKNRHHDDNWLLVSLYMLSCWTKYYHISWFCQNINEEFGLQQTKSFIFSLKSEIKRIMTKKKHIFTVPTCFVVAPDMRRSVVTIPGWTIIDEKWKMKTIAYRGKGHLKQLP